MRYLFERNIPWDTAFGQLGELDLFGFLMEVHVSATVNAKGARTGAEAVWGVFAGLKFLQPRLPLDLPLDALKRLLPTGAAVRGPAALLAGAHPLPPETLPRLYAFICDGKQPRILRSWAFALVFSAVSSLRQANTQHIAFYGELLVNNRRYLMSQHADGKSRGKTPTVFLTPIEDLSGSAAWFDEGRSLLPPGGDFLWADHLGPPTSDESILLNCPLPADRIQAAIQLVLQHACGMTKSEAQRITKHSARKLLVSVAQAAGCSWEICIELGHWSGTSVDRSFLLPHEDLRRKHALKCMDMPKRYSHNARLQRVARIIGNQMARIRQYLRVKPRTHATFETLWELVPPYCPKVEGA